MSRDTAFAATTTQPTGTPGERVAVPQDPARRFGLAYVLLVLAMIAGSGFAIWHANRAFAPEMYSAHGPARIADALSNGRNYALFDLNINIREIRNAQIAALPQAPDVAILGASHWQEAHADIVTHKRLLNAHVHRDYYEDMLAMVEMFVRHDKMPRQLIVAIRDKLMTPLEARKDYLWLPGIPYYRAMARRLGIETPPVWSTLPVQRWREQLSLPMLYANVARWYKADELPHPTLSRQFAELDVMLPGGSILWSDAHAQLYTPERTMRGALEFAASQRLAPPEIDQKGVAALDRLFAFLKSKGVEVFLVHPPFNPIYFDAVKDSPYMAGLQRIETLTRGFAEKFGMHVIGSFDPRAIGCDAGQYIDAEHASPECLAKVLAQYVAIDRDGKAPPAGATTPDAVSSAAPIPSPSALRAELSKLERTARRPAAAAAPAPVAVAAAPTVVQAAAPAEPELSAADIVFSRLGRSTPASPAAADPETASELSAAEVVLERLARNAPTPVATPAPPAPAAAARAPTPLLRKARPARETAAAKALIWPGDPDPVTGRRVDASTQLFNLWATALKPTVQ